MARITKPLSDSECSKAKPKEKDYSLYDGNGLILLVKKSGVKIWRFRYKRPNGKQTMLSLGNYPEVKLAAARKVRDEYRSMLAEGIDPSDDRKAEQGKSKTLFEPVAREWHEATRQRWSKDHAVKVLKRLELHVFPFLGEREVSDIRPAEIVDLIRRISDQGADDVASRVLQQCNNIFAYAHRVGHIVEGGNPAVSAKGAFTFKKATHRPALDLADLPKLLEDIEGPKLRGVTRLAILVTLHTFVRSSELRMARWGEIDFDRAVWEIPPEREEIPGVKHSTRGSKMRSTHVVPLSRQVIGFFRELQELTGHNELIFSGDHSHNRPLSENTINQALQRLGYDTKKDVCAHGFRTTACSALNESGHFSRDAVERQMSHQDRKSVV